MDKLGNLVKKERAGMSLHKSSQALSKSNDEYSITTYTGELTQENVVRNFARIKACFPAISPEFYKILLERLKEKGFSDERLSDSVNNLIDNFQYPNPLLLISSPSTIELRYLTTIKSVRLSESMRLLSTTSLKFTLTRRCFT